MLRVEGQEPRADLQAAAEGVSLLLKQLKLVALSSCAFDRLPQALLALSSLLHCAHDLPRQLLLQSLEVHSRSVFGAVFGFRHAGNHLAHQSQLSPNCLKVVVVLPEKEALVSVVLGAAVAFVVLALFVEVANQRSEPRKMAAPIQSFEQLGLMVLSAELKPIVKERYSLVE